MNDYRLLPDDPKITAYALGELAGDERAQVEAALRRNPALRATVDEIRATAAQVEAALAGEAIFRPTPTAAANAGIVLELNGHRGDAALAKAALPRAGGTVAPEHAATEATAYRPTHSRQRMLQFPQVYYVVATALAACFAVVFALREPPRQPAPRAPRTIRHEIVLVPPNPPPTETPESVTDTAPAETSTVVVSLPPPAAGTIPAMSAGTTEPAPDSAPATRVPAFFTGNLSLMGQAKSAQDSATQTPATNRVVEVGGSVLPSDGQTAHAASPGDALENKALTPVLGLAGGAARKDPPGSVASAETRTRRGGPAGGTITIGGIAAGTATAPAAQLFSDALTPPVAAPVVAGSTRPAVVPNATTFTGNASGGVPAPGGSDVVVLSAFTVTADHAVGFATAASGQRMAPDKRQVARRDDLPPPPTGARFGRNTEAYSYIRDNDFLAAAQNRLSTFAIDVDSASYANVRRILQLGSPPPRDAVRIEELVNYFPYRYAAPKDDAPFAASLEVADAPWAPKHRLVRIGLKAREVSAAQRPAASLVFLLDVSGSMNQPNKLPLVKESLRLLLGKLRADDRVAIVTYAGNSGLALSSTPVAQSREILNALDALTPGGSTNGAMGIQLAYEIAKANFISHGINRVILCTDGDFNVGTTSEGELVRLIEEKATSGVFLTVLGFGMGNYKDATLEKLADKGNGNYGYIDTRREAEKILVEQVSSTLMTVAKDVKIQVEFNPATVSSYRLIGYENRLLRKEDFNNDNVDAGEIGAGHTVTALYEVVPVGAEVTTGGPPPIDELRYGAQGAVSSRLEMPNGKREPHSNELLTVKVRYKKPDSLFSFPKTLQFPLVNTSKAFARASADFRFAAAVAQFGMILRGSPHRGSATMRDVAAWAAGAAGVEDDPGGYRGEFLELVHKAQTMME